MVQSLPGYLNLCLDVCSPSQVLGDVLHRGYLKLLTLSTGGPTDLKRSIGPLLSLPEVHDQLFSFAHVQRETVVLAPWCKSLYIIQVCGLIIVGNEAQNHSIIRKFDNRSGAVRGHAVVCVERVEQGAQDTALWGSYNNKLQIKLRWALFVSHTIIQSIMRSEMCSLHLTHPSGAVGSRHCGARGRHCGARGGVMGDRVMGDGVGGELAYFHHLRSAGEEVLNPAAEWRV